ncbi:heparin lyase I family protein [Formosa sp. S-31]|uniref:heparin lyase I family protein n=1 Tax=Formosa sp. S-31 TaxID=2790949 RepID=UPI003EB88475
MKYYPFILLVILSSLKFNAQNEKKNRLRFTDDFNTLPSREKGYRNFEITDYNCFLMDTISGKGRMNDGYLITEMNRTGVSGKPKRTEFGVDLIKGLNKVQFLGISIKIPNSFKFDQSNLGRQIMICQFHSKPAPGSTWNHYVKYNPFNRPSIALFIVTNDNENYYLVLKYGNNGKSEFEYKDEIWSTIAVKKIELNNWIDIVIEAKWSRSNSGYIASWLNNEPFTPFNGVHNKVYGANMHNESPVYFKFGQYRYFDDSHIHQIYFDELRIGDSFDQVTLYDEVPKMFTIQTDMGFIKNHE